LRIDDLDAPRCPLGAAELIQQQLSDHGLHWDGPPYRQTEHFADYAAARDALIGFGMVYACRCTRAQLSVSQTEGPDGPIYPATCRGLGLPTAQHALRFRLPEQPICIDDQALGRQCRAPEAMGDFIIWRADGQPGYQLASVVDDRNMGVSHIVRGADLLSSSLRQAALAPHLGLRFPHCSHLPLVCDATGKKLSKQNGAPALAADVVANLCTALSGLGCSESPNWRGGTVHSVLGQALSWFAGAQWSRH
jgi:glutamyl-Q tRNA(Asp) synthetase